MITISLDASGSRVKGIIEAFLTGRVNSINWVVGSLLKNGHSVDEILKVINFFHPDFIRINEERFKIIEKRLISEGLIKRISQ